MLPRPAKETAWFPTIHRFRPKRRSKKSARSRTTTVLRRTAAERGGGGDKAALLQAQLEESFKRARETGERLKDTHERLLRTAAEFDNYRKRAVKEKEDVQRFGSERLLKDFLPVMDNLERALEHAEQHDPRQVIDGVQLVQKLFENTLAKHGVTGFSAVGKPFDPGLPRGADAAGQRRAARHRRFGDGQGVQAERPPDPARCRGGGQSSHSRRSGLASLGRGNGWVQG